MFDKKVTDKDELKKELQIIGSQLVNWPNLPEMKDYNRESKEYFLISVMKDAQSGWVKTGISMNYRPSTMEHLALTKLVMKENTCTIYSQSLANSVQFNLKRDSFWVFDSMCSFLRSGLHI